MLTREFAVSQKMTSKDRGRKPNQLWRVCGKMNTICAIEVLLYVVFVIFSLPLPHVEKTDFDTAVAHHQCNTLKVLCMRVCVCVYVCACVCECIWYSCFLPFFWLASPGLVVEWLPWSFDIIS